MPLHSPVGLPFLVATRAPHVKGGCVVDVAVVVVSASVLPVDEDEDDEDSEVVDAAVDVVDDDVALRGSNMVGMGGVNV